LSHQGVRAARAREASGGEARVLLRDFNAEEIMIWLSARRAEQEQPLAAADFDLDRRSAAEEIGRRERLRQLAGSEKMPAEIQRRIDFGE
jgi:hypothetical protein